MNPNRYRQIYSELVNALPVIPNEQVVYYSYKGGLATQHKTENDARRASNLFEKVVMNKAEIDAAKSLRNNLDIEARNQLISEFRQQYPKLPEKVFDLTLTEANSEYSVSQTDFVEHFEMLLDFASELVAIME